MSIATIDGKEVDTVTVMNTPISDIGKQFSYRVCIMQFIASMLTGNIKSNELTKEVSDDHSIQGRRISVRKYILSSDEMREVTSAIQNARNYFNSKTLPWENEGERILPSHLVLDLKSEMESKIDDINTKIEKLISVLPKLIEEDKKNLGSAFNSTDYPTATELRKKYRLRIKIRPLSTNFIVEGIEDAHAKLIQDKINEQLKNTLKDTKLYQLNELNESIEHLKSRLVDKEKGFKNSSIVNILQKAEDINTLTLDKDVQMQKLANNVTEGFSRLNAEIIRENKEARIAAVSLANEKLAEIKKVMEGY